MLSIPEICDAVRADFAERGITAEVIFGGWKKDYINAGNRIVFGMSGFESDAPGLPNAPGLQWTDDGHAARALFTRVQSVTVWVHAAAPSERDPKRSENAQRATAKLLHQTLGALYRYAHGSFGWGSGQWPADGRQDFVYGSLASFVAQFSIPVLDDEQVVVPRGDDGPSAPVSSA